MDHPQRCVRHIKPLLEAAANYSSEETDILTEAVRGRINEAGQSSEMKAIMIRRQRSLLYESEE